MEWYACFHCSVLYFGTCALFIHMPLPNCLPLYQGLETCTHKAPLFQETPHLFKRWHLWLLGLISRRMGILRNEASMISLPSFSGEHFRF